MDKLRQSERFRTGLAVVAIFGGSLAVASCSSSPEKSTTTTHHTTTTSRNDTVVRLNDYTMSCNVTTSPLHPGSDEYKYTKAKDPKAFVDKKHAVSIPLAQDPKVDNMIRAVVDINKGDGGPQYFDIVELYTDGHTVSIQKMSDAGFASEKKTKEPTQTLTDGSKIEGYSGNLNYTITREHGAAVLSAYCDETFISSFNDWEEEIYHANITSTTTSSTPVTLPGTV